MKRFSLIQQLQTPKKKEETPIESIQSHAEVEENKEQTMTEESDTTAYRVYMIETEARSLKIGVPLENVDKFDSYFNANPLAITKIEEHLSRFDAIII